MVSTVLIKRLQFIAGFYRRKRFLRSVFSGLLLMAVFIGTLTTECFSQNAQSKIPTKALNLYLASQKDVQAQNFHGAKQKLRQAILAWPQYSEAHQALADILRLAHRYDSAAFHYQEVLQATTFLTPLTYFGLGISQLGLGKYAEAEAAFQKYLSVTRRNLNKELPRSVDNVLKDPVFLSEKYLRDTRFSLEQLDQGVGTFAGADIVPFSAEINTADDEYFPHFTADLKKLIFTRKVNDQENFFESDFETKGNGSEPIPLAGRINSIDYNEGAHCISPDGKYIFFTGCNRPGGLGSCDIYISKKEGGLWSSPMNIGTPVNTSGWEAQPSISADGRTLYFVSNRKGGFGGYDIWKSSLSESGKWSDPVNLGPEINTAFDESAPFIHADNHSLYFTSNGWPGFGKKDFFKSGVDENGNWSVPVNLGQAFNDYRDQSSITISMNGKSGVLASQRDLQRNDLDLYYFDVPDVLQPKSVSYVHGKVIDSASLEYLAAQVTIFDLTGQKIYYSGQSDLEDGRFLAPLEPGKTYTLHVERLGYLLYSEHYELQDSSLSRDVYEINIPLKKIETGKNEVLKNIFFETNQAILLPESSRELDVLIKFLKTNTEIRIEIGGHTDNTGTADYNHSLSEKRAKAVWTYLTKEGIPPERVEFKGHGATRPLVDNSTSEGRKINRRTDFKILSF